MSGILTVEQVAEKRIWILSYVESAAKIQALALCDSHEALRAENERLTGCLESYREQNASCHARIAELEKERDAADQLARTFGAAESVACDERDAAIAERNRQSRMVTALADTLDATEDERDRLITQRDKWQSDPEPNGAVRELVKERDGLRRAIEEMMLPCIEWMISKNGPDWEKRISFIADNYVEKMVFGIASTGKRALAAVPAPAPVDGGVL